MGRLRGLLWLGDKRPENGDFSSLAPRAGRRLQRQRVTLGGRVLHLLSRLIPGRRALVER